MAITDLHDTLGIIHIRLDPVLHLGGLSIHWYGIMYAVAFLVAFRFGVLPHLRARGLEQATIERLTAWTILFGLLGARLYYVIQQPDLRDYLTHPIRIIAVWEGGMAFFGAIMAGLATIWVLARRNQLPFWLLADAGVLFAVIGQPIGRIGNMINGDILGPQSNLPWAMAYDVHTNPGQCAVLQPGFFCGIGYQPAALYEAIGTLLILGLLLLIRRRRVRDGILAIAYVAAYCVSQLIIFQFRTSEASVFRGLKQAQLTALVLLVAGVPALIELWRRNPGAPAPALVPAAERIPEQPAATEPAAAKKPAPKPAAKTPAGGRPPLHKQPAATRAAPVPKGTTPPGPDGAQVSKPAAAPPPPPAAASKPEQVPPLPPVPPIPPPPPKPTKSDG